MATQTPPSKPMVSEIASTSSTKRRWPKWQIGALILMLVSGGVSFSATNMLLKLPKTPNCVGIFLPFASAAKRLYCAQVRADQNTVDGLLAAIHLVDSLPEDHPLRNEINRNIERWSVDLLNLAEDLFQNGQLDEAIAAAKKVPADSEAAELVDKKVEDWRSIWTKALAIERELEAALGATNWNLAFRAAVKLAYLNNQYWATTQYEANIKKIQLAREEARKLEGAFAALKKDDASYWIEAVNIALVIGKDSYVYETAQEIIIQAKTKLAERMNLLVERRDWNTLKDLAIQMPEVLQFGNRLKAWRSLADAGSIAKTGTIAALQDAIKQLEEFKSSNPYYQDAQALMGRWQLEIQDIEILTRARQYAEPQSIRNLSAAIREARKIPSSHPRHSEARQEINRWGREIQIIEDRPILNQAERLAQGYNVSAWQAAINKAQQVGSSRALHPEARELIRGWQSSIERSQDQPTLDQAQLLANQGDYSRAIVTAQQIGRGRALSGQAQENIQAWQREVQGTTTLRNAIDSARSRTAEGLTQAIRQVQQIPSSAKVHSEAIARLNDWSEDLLAIAITQANSSLSAAIQTANQIPRQASSYKKTQTQIAYWQQLQERSTPPRSDNRTASPSPPTTTTPATPTPNPAAINSPESPPTPAPETAPSPIDNPESNPDYLELTPSNFRYRSVQ